MTGPDIQVAPPADGIGSGPTGGDPGDGSTKKASGTPAGFIGKGKDWYRGLDKRDRMVVLMGALVVLLAIVMISIYWSGGGGAGGSGDDPVMVPISDWDR
ncbi:MAG: hypothetical protein KAS77_00675, partial [Thermoplasmata archaeon]|nr:hypothetical protein [Thermoplasmata archaeon]